MTPLMEFVRELRAAQPRCFVPDFDPASGGVRARALFLFEKPGPKTDPKNNGSGFISIHNDDPTAAATHGFLLSRGLPVELCLFANAIPWWDDDRAISRDHKTLAIAPMATLIRLLPELRAMVLVGKVAQRQWERSRLPVPNGVTIYRSYHPSPLVRAKSPNLWLQIPTSWPNGVELVDTP